MGNIANGLALKKRVRVELFHPVTDSGRTYSRGVHDLDGEKAERFLAIRIIDVGRKFVPVAREYGPESQGAPRGTVTAA